MKSDRTRDTLDTLCEVLWVILITLMFFAVCTIFVSHSYGGINEDQPRRWYVQDTVTGEQIKVLLFTVTPDVQAIQLAEGRTSRSGPWNATHSVSRHLICTDDGRCQFPLYYTRGKADNRWFALRTCVPFGSCTPWVVEQNIECEGDVPGGGCPCQIYRSNIIPGGTCP